MIAGYKLAQNHLMVCQKHGKNCNTCKKFGRTLLTLDCLDKLDNFKQVFYVGYYCENRSKYMSKMLERRISEDAFSIEIYDMFEREKPGYINQILSDNGVFEESLIAY